jgi:CheY-like chemotaxis protein
MSHELRTPLNAILGYAQILKRKRELSQSAKDEVEIIYQSGQHLLTLINDILDLSKIEARKMELYPVNINFPAFLDGIVGIIRMRAQQKDLRFEYEFAPVLPSGIQADETRLRQVLINLLGNAVKFTDSGGTVTFEILDFRLQIEEGTDGKSKISNLKFQISDTGVGMTPEQVDKIFEPFEQVGDTQRRTEGTGLGLAISRQLVGLMGGELRVQSEPGAGSTFWFKAAFPVAEVQAEGPVLQADISGYTGERQTVLVVDDYEENRHVLLNMLEPLGFDVVLAQNGQEGIAKAREVSPNFILMDLVMPTITGFEAVEQLRQMPEFRETPIIAISASAFEHDQQNSKSVGCNAFLSKPIQDQQLYALLAQYLPIEWIYEEISANPKTALNQAEADIIPPPRETLEALYELAMIGNMRRVREQLDQLEMLDDRYIPFISRIRPLAKAFEDKQIAEVVRQYLEGEEA